MKMWKYVQFDVGERAIKWQPALYILSGLAAQLAQLSQTAGRAELSRGSELACDNGVNMVQDKLKANFLERCSIT
jgi:hypothetical protein